MRKVVLGMVAGAALAIGSAASAAITVTSSVGILPTYSVVNGPAQSTVAFSQNPEASGSFNGWFEFNNSLNGLYSIIVSTSTPGATITSAALSGLGGSPIIASNTGSANTLSLLTGNLSSGNYRFTFGGNAPANGGVVSGNLTFNHVAVPEPATWAMMLLGFAGIGLVMRRRPVLAQLG